LEIICANANKLIPFITNAGAVFLGAYSPVALGDYFAGSSHILPTGKSARFSSGLSVCDFFKRINFITYDKKTCIRDVLSAVNIADSEGMIEHKKSLEIRETI